jgi:Domain of unknown function (DUF4129)
VIRPAGKLAAFHASDDDPSLGILALKGHGLSRAAKTSKTVPALAAEGMQMTKKIVPQGLKPGNSSLGLMARLKSCPFKTSLVLRKLVRLKSCPFKASIFAHSLRVSIVWTSRTCLVCIVLAAFLAATPGRADTPAQPAGHWHDSSLQDYRNHLLALTTLVGACAKTRDTKTCDPAQVGQDDRIAVSDAANADHRLVRYGWLRVLLSQSQDKDKPADEPAKSAKEAITGQPGPPKPTAAELLQGAEVRLAHDLAQTDSPIAPAPAHSQERDAMRQVLAGRDFRNLKDSSLSEKFWEKVGVWLNRILESISKVTPRSVWIGRIVFWGFIFAVCIALVWGLLQVERRWRIRLIPDSDGPAAGAASARDWQLWLQDAGQAASAGLWREAIHYLYWASISRLESRRLWPADRARTPREYLALVAPEDPRKPGLATLTGSFERFWYGGRSAGQSDYLKAEQLATALITGSGITVPGSVGQ